MVERLKDKFGVAVLNGDATVANDTELIASQGVPLVQIATINGCHLDANLITKANMNSAPFQQLLHPKI